MAYKSYKALRTRSQVTSPEIALRRQQPLNRRIDAAALKKVQTNFDDILGPDHWLIMNTSNFMPALLAFLKAPQYEEVLFQQAKNAFYKEIRASTLSAGRPETKAQDIITRYESDRHLLLNVLLMNYKYRGGPNSLSTNVLATQPTLTPTAAVPCLINLPSDPHILSPETLTYFKNITGIEKPQAHDVSPLALQEFAFYHEAGHCDGNEPSHLILLKQSKDETTDDVTGIKAESNSDITAAKTYMASHGGKTDVVEYYANLRVIEAVLQGGDDHLRTFELDQLLQKRKPHLKDARPYLSPSQVTEGYKAVIDYLQKKAGLNEEEYRKNSKPGGTNPTAARQIYAALASGLAARSITSPYGRIFAERYIKAFEYFMPHEALDMRRTLSVQGAKSPSKGPHSPVSF